MAVNSENTTNHKSGDKYFGEWVGGKVHGIGVYLNNTLMSR